MAEYDRALFFVSSAQNDEGRHHNPSHGPGQHAEVLPGGSSITGIGNGPSTGRHNKDHAQPQKEVRDVTEEPSGRRRSSGASWRTRIEAHDGPGLHVGRLTI